MRQSKLILLLVILSLLSMMIVGCGGDANNGTATKGDENPATQATLTFAAGEWYAQQTAIAAESTPNPPGPSLSK